MRKFQIEFSLEGHELEKFIHGTDEPPPEFLKTTVGSIVTTSANPDYLKWKKQDRLISSWLIGSMTETILSQMLHCKTSREIWKCLNQIFNSRNLAQVMTIRNKLQVLRKRDKTLNDYFTEVKQCIDALDSVGKTISEEDHIIYILAGLGSEYESMVSALTTKTEINLL